MREKIKINDNELLLSFDVISLFTKITVYVGKSEIFNCLKYDSTVVFKFFLLKAHLTT